MNARRSIDGVITPAKHAVSRKLPHAQPQTFSIPPSTVTPFRGARQRNFDVRPPRPTGVASKPSLSRQQSTVIPKIQNPITAIPQASRAPSPEPRAGWQAYLQYGLVVVAAMLLGILAQSLIFGQAVLAFYAVAVVVLKVRSSTTFALAIIALVAVVVLFTVRANGVLANNFAVYTFWLLAIGTLSLLIEVKRERKAKNTTLNA